MTERAADHVGATRTSFEVLLTLQKLGPSRLTEIADHLDIPESTAHRHLSTLDDMRYVSRDGERYQIGLRLARLGGAAQSRDPAFRMARPHVQRLARESGERAQFVAEDHGLGVYVHVETGADAVRVGFDVGRQIHLHCSSAGKSILSQYDRARVDGILDRWGMPAHTEHTITDREAYYAELDRVRDRGYALNYEEHIDGLTAAAVPVTRDEAVIGALVVAGPSRRLEGDRLEAEIPEMLLASANELELNVAYGNDDRTDHLIE